MIICLSADQKDKGETICSLRFGSDVMGVIVEKTKDEIIQ